MPSSGLYQVLLYERFFRPKSFLGVQKLEFSSENFKCRKNKLLLVKGYFLMMLWRNVNLTGHCL